MVARSLVQSVARNVASSAAGSAVGISIAVPLLPNTTGLWGAYGLSEVVADYSGPAVRLRRSSDSAESDFSLSNGRVNASAITSWLAGSVGYAVTLYDQSGNANDISNATNANCPVWTPYFAPEGSLLTGIQGVSQFKYSVTKTLDGRDFGIGYVGRISGAIHLANFCYVGTGAGATPQLNIFHGDGQLKRYHSVATAGASSFYVQPEPQLFFFRSTATEFRFRGNGVSSDATANSAGNLVDIFFSDGYAGATGPVYMQMNALLIYDAAPSDGTLTSIDSAVTERFALPSRTKSWVFVGDSLTAGFGSITGRSFSVRLSDRRADNSIRFCNEGGSGLTTTTMLALIDRYQSFYDAGHTENRAFLLGGTNDLRTAVATATIISNLTSIVSGLQTTGFDVSIMTIPPGGGVNETDRLTVNASINGGSTGADTVIDIGSDSRWLDSGKFYDDLHFNDAGNAIMAELIDAAI